MADFEHTFYSRGPSGEVRKTVLESDIPGAVEMNSEPAEGFELINEATYRTELAAIDAAKIARQSAVRAAEQADKLANLLELTALGVSLKAARSMSGYIGEVPDKA